MIIAAHVVNNDEDDEANLGLDEDTLERKIQEEVESRLLRNQNNAIVAKPIGSSKISTTTTTDQADGLKLKLWCCLILIVCLGLSAGVTGVFVSRKKGTTISSI